MTQKRMANKDSTATVMYNGTASLYDVIGSARNKFSPVQSKCSWASIGPHLCDPLGSWLSPCGREREDGSHLNAPCESKHFTDICPL